MSLASTPVPRLLRCDYRHILTVLSVELQRAVSHIFLVRLDYVLEEGDRFWSINLHLNRGGLVTITGQGSPSPSSSRCAGSKSARIDQIAVGYARQCASHQGSCGVSRNRLSSGHYLGNKPLTPHSWFLAFPLITSAFHRIVSMILFKHLQSVPQILTQKTGVGANFIR